MEPVDPQKPLSVAELITKLQTMPQDLDVCIIRGVNVDGTSLIVNVEYVDHHTIVTTNKIMRVGDEPILKQRQVIILS
jgi:hypothetical protein